MKAKKIVLFWCLIVCFAALLPLNGANAQDDDIGIRPAMTKDGINAKISITSETQAIKATVTVTNLDCKFLGKVKCKLVLPEGMTSSVTEFDVDTINIGEQKTFDFEIVKSNSLVPGGDAQNKFDVRYIVIAVCVLVVIAVGFVLVRKRKKNNIAMLLIGCVLLPYFAFNTQGYADAATRSISLRQNATMGEEAFRVGAEIEYEYDFKEEEVQKTSGMNGFQITYFFGPNPEDSYNDEVAKAIADCGFTVVPVGGWQQQNVKDILTLMDKYGIKCNVWVGESINNLITGDNSNISQEEVDAVVQALVDEYKDFDNIAGWDIWDEPDADKFDILHKIVSAFNRIDPERETFIDLFPNYASPEQLRTPDYSVYLERYMNEVDPDYICFDFYHFKDETNKDRIDDFFDNMEDVRNAGLKYGKDQMQIMLLTKHMSYGNITPEQLRWEVNMALVYGMKRISYFTFWTDENLEQGGWENACMNSKGEKNPHYYDVQAVNEWLYPLGNELFGKTSTAVFHKGGADTKGMTCADYVPYGELGLCTGNDFVIGFFDDESFMIVNKQFYAEKEGEKNSIVFEDINDNLEYFDTKTATWRDAEEDSVATRNDNGKYVISFEAGQGILFRVNE